MLFAKGDVNGSRARPVFKFLKSRLPDSLGEAIKWNFTKFLVDRAGHAVMRYGPKTNPLSFEGDVRKALAGKAVISAESSLVALAAAMTITRSRKNTSCAFQHNCGSGRKREADQVTPASSLVRSRNRCWLDSIWCTSEWLSGRTPGSSQPFPV